MKDINRHIVIWLSIPLFLSVCMASGYGFFQPHLYSQETLNWQAQSLGQDLVDLFVIAPLFLFISIMVYKGNRAAILIWGGFVLYFFYSFTIYCFSLHFNEMFLIYCLALGLSFYSLIYFAYLVIRGLGISAIRNPSISKSVGYFFIITACIFGFLWTAEITPALIRNTQPGSLVVSGLATNPIHVLDLAILLPGVFIIGIAIIRNIKLGLTLAPMVLTFLILMDITIGILVLVMLARHVEAELLITFIMTILALFSIALLIAYIRNSSFYITEKSNTNKHGQSDYLHKSS